VWKINSDDSIGSGQFGNLDTDDSGDIGNSTFVAQSTPKQTQFHQTTAAVGQSLAVVRRNETPLLNKVGRKAVALLEQGSEKFVDSLVPAVALLLISNLGWGEEDQTVLSPRTPLKWNTPLRKAITSKRVVFGRTFPSDRPPPAPGTTRTVRKTFSTPPRLREPERRLTKTPAQYRYREPPAEFDDSSEEALTQALRKWGKEQPESPPRKIVKVTTNMDE
jgi:hypothetical protein